MCYLCDETDELGQSCQDCGRLICFHVESGDDVVRPAYVTAGGDLYCDICGRKHDEADEQQLDGEFSQPLLDELQE